MLKIILGTTTQGTKIALESVYVEPTKCAIIKYQLIQIDQNVTNHTYKMEGEQYSKWGADDTILYHIICNRHKLQYKPFVEPEFIDEAIVYRDEATGEIKCEHIKIQNPNYNASDTK
jgi:hypothetical protein